MWRNLRMVHQQCRLSQALQPGACLLLLPLQRASSRPRKNQSCKRLISHRPFIGCRPREKLQFAGAFRLHSCDFCLEVALLTPYPRNEKCNVGQGSKNREGCSDAMHLNWIVYSQFVYTYPVFHQHGIIDPSRPDKPKRPRGL